MKQNNWIRTLLKSYNYLERIVRGIDKTVKKISLNSFYYNSANYQSTYALSNKLIELNERKVLLINTKIIVDEILKTVGKNGAKYLTLRFIDGLKNEEIALLNNESGRTVTRKIQKYLSKAQEVLKKYNLDAKKLFEMYREEQWLLDIYYGDIEW